MIQTNDYPTLLAVARAGAGVNNISIKEATDQGVCVFNTPGANAKAVAELVFIMLGMYARQVNKALSFCRTLVTFNDVDIPHLVEKRKSQFTGFEIAGKTLTVIGLGKIGVLVANAGIEHGMNVIGFDAFPTLSNMHQLSPKVVIAKRLEDALAKADVLSVHVPLNEKTKHMIGASQLSHMKSGVILMNYAREGIYDDDAVIQALDRGKVKAYITDFPSQKLLENEAVMCTPHLGASTNESEENCAVMAVKQLKNYLEYGVVSNSFNFPTVEAYPHQATINRLVVISQDVPNMIAKITSVFGEADINIQSYTNESNGTIGYNLVDVATTIPDEVAEKVRALPQVLQARVIAFS
jgi:D-3-phosphoglycerate dehydrogenase